MPISFSHIPQGWKVPLVYIEVDPSQAGTPTFTKYVLLTDYKIAAGTGVVDTPIACASVQSAVAIAGQGSPLARMFTEFFLVNKASPCLLLPIAEPAAGVAATGDIVVTAGPTQPGTLDLYIAGQNVNVGVNAGDTTAQVAGKIQAAIVAMPDLPVTASAPVGATTTLTAKWKGQTGNDIRVELNVLGPNGGEMTPIGLTLTLPGGGSNTLINGTGVPNWTNAIANLGDEPYEYVGMGHTDTGSLLAWGTEYGFTDSGRWGWIREDYGHVFAAKRDTYSNLFAYGPSNNTGVISIMAVEPTSPSPIYEWVGAYTGTAASALSIDPARPLQTLTFDGIRAAAKTGRFNKTQLNALATVGLAIQSTTPDGTPAIAREQTTYQKNILGQPDNAYELVTTLATLAELFRRIKQAITNKYARCKLANDGTKFGPGQAIVTPNIIKAEIVAEYRQSEYDGLVENTDIFKKYLIVERDDVDPNRVNVLYPPDIINQLRMFAVLGQFRLQFPSAGIAA
jgi:phage tail sheath gpL-like